MRGLMGTFALMPLRELVDLLVRRSVTGSLVCERGTVQKSLQLLEGKAAGAASNDPREYLGQLLMNFGHLTEEQLTKAFETQLETKVRLGKVLTMVGLVSPEVVRETLALKIRETVLDAFMWDSGTFRVDDAAPPVRDELDVAVPLADIAREAEFRTTAWAAMRAPFPTGTATLVVHEERVDRVQPGSVDARLLDLAREGKSIDEIGLALHATDFHLYQRLYALHRHGVVEAAAVAWQEEPEPATRAPQPPDVGALARLRQSMLDPPRTPKLRVPAHAIALMRLSAAEKYLLGRCNGQRDLRQIVQLAPLPELEVLSAVQRFADGRIVELG